MSRATAAVRFQDGTVKWGIYDGTSDILIPRLFDGPDEPWDAYYADRKGLPKVELWPEAEGEPEPVTIYSDYGGGWTWESMATRNVVTEGLDPFEYVEDLSSAEYKRPRTDGTPEWFSEAIREARDA